MDIITTNDRQQAVCGMPASGRVWMSTVPAMGLASGAAAGSKRVCSEGTAVSGLGYTSIAVFATGAFPGNPAWSPPI